MRAPNYYAHPGFERAGLRRREPDWIRERVADPASVFVPVWRSHNLVIELADGEPRAARLTMDQRLRRFSRSLTAAGRNAASTGGTIAAAGRSDAAAGRSVSARACGSGRARAAA